MPDGLQRSAAELDAVGALAKPLEVESAFPHGYGVKAHADALSIKLHEYEWDRSLMLQRTPAIIEGLLKIVIENTDITVHNATACVVGQGTIGAVLGRYLVALGAHTHVAARNPEQRAAAYVAGASPHVLEELPAVPARAAVQPVRRLRAV